MLTVRNFALTDKEYQFVVNAIAQHISTSLSEDNDIVLERRLIQFTRDLFLCQRECLHPSER